MLPCTSSTSEVQKGGDKFYGDINAQLSNSKHGNFILNMGVSSIA